MKDWYWQSVGRALRAIGILTPYRVLGQEWFEGRGMDGSVLGHMESFGELRMFGKVFAWKFTRPMSKDEIAKAWPVRTADGDLVK